VSTGDDGDPNAGAMQVPDGLGQQSFVGARITQQSVD
jgi:hypothetical protein